MKSTGLEMSLFQPEMSLNRGHLAGTDSGGHAGTFPPKGGNVPPAMSRDKCPPAMSPAGGLREQMPVAAELVDLLRAFNGKAGADAQIKRAMAGQGGFWVSEVGPDGVERQFGSQGEVHRPMVVRGKVWGVRP